MDRKTWMSVLAKADGAEIARRLDALGPRSSHRWLRPPETGGVMVRGRAGGTGAPFNIGEITVTRCTLRLDEGAVGHAYVQGRDRAHAETAALVDALMQTDAAPDVLAHVLAPLADAAATAQAKRAAKAAATKVDFFTLARGED